MAGGMGVAFDAINRLARSRALFRPRDVEALGVSRSWLEMLVFLGELRRLTPTIYTRWRVDFPPVTLASVSTPSGVACLATALQLHGWDDVEAPEVWWAIPRSVRQPMHPPVPMRFLRLAPDVLEQDVELRSIHNVDVRVHSLERTIADCLRYRHRLGDSRKSTWWRRLLSEAQRMTGDRRRSAPRFASAAPPR